MQTAVKVLGVALLLLTFTPNWSFAQDGKQSKLQTMRVAYVTNELGLSSAEAEEFFPIYNEYRAEKRQLKEAATRGLGEIKIKEKELSLLKKYNRKFSQVISERKAALVEKVDKDFSVFILTHIQEKKN